MLLSLVEVRVLPWPADFSIHERFHMRSSHAQVRRDQQDRHATTHPHDTFAVQRLANADCRNSETDIRKDERVPVEMERHLTTDDDAREHRDAEEPEAQTPDEDGNDSTHDSQDLYRRRISTPVIVVVRKLVRKRNDGE